MQPMLPLLSVLDQTPIPAGGTAADAAANTLDLAAHADRLGYHRYWLAEHHASPALAGVAPEVLIGPAALATRRIRVGSGGIMLPHYSPFKVAESFALLAAMAPGRIDLGLGRAPGSDGRTAYALQRDRREMAPYDFPDQLAELDAYLTNSLAPTHPFAALGATLPSGRGTGPELWLLGSSADSAQLAAERGLPYCFADFINRDGASLARHYRAAFKPSARLAQPYVAVASWAVAADSRAEAERLALPAAMMFAHLHTGRLIPVPTVADAEAWLLDHPEAPRHRRRSLLGTGAEVADGIAAVAAEYGADEVLLVNILADHASRRRSYALVADAWGLAPLAHAA